MSTQGQADAAAVRSAGSACPPVPACRLPLPPPLQVSGAPLRLDNGKIKCQLSDGKENIASVFTSQVAKGFGDEGLRPDCLVRVQEGNVSAVGDSQVGGWMDGPGGEAGGGMMWACVCVVVVLCGGRVECAAVPPLPSSLRPSYSHLPPPFTSPLLPPPPLPRPPSGADCGQG